VTTGTPLRVHSDVRETSSNSTIPFLRSIRRKHYSSQRNIGSIRASTAIGQIAGLARTRECTATNLHRLHSNFCQQVRWEVVTIPKIASLVRCCHSVSQSGNVAGHADCDSSLSWRTLPVIKMARVPYSAFLPAV